MNTIEELREFCREFRGAVKDVDHLNVVLFGRPGSGKSSFVNLVLSASSENRIRTDAIVGACEDADDAGDSAMTPKVQRHVVMEQLHLWDLPGCSEVVSSQYVSNLIRGSLRDGYHPSECDESSMKYNGVVDAQRMAHCLIVFVDARTLPGAVPSIQKWFEQAASPTLANILLLTHCDEVAGIDVEDFEGDDLLAALDSSAEMRKAKQAVQKCGAAPGSIFQTVLLPSRFNLQAVIPLVIKALLVVMQNAKDLLLRGFPPPEVVKRTNYWFAKNDDAEDAEERPANDYGSDFESDDEDAHDDDDDNAYDSDDY